MISAHVSGKQLLAAMDMPPDSAREFASATGLDCPILYDSARFLSSRYAVTSCPAVVVAEPNGKQVGRFVSDGRELNARSIDRILRMVAQ